MKTCYTPQTPQQLPPHNPPIPPFYPNPPNPPNQSTPLPPPLHIILSFSKIHTPHPNLITHYHNYPNYLPPPPLQPIIIPPTLLVSQPPTASSHIPLSLQPRYSPPY